MKPNLKWLLLLPVIAIAWQVGFKTPQPFVSAQDPFGGAPAGNDPFSGSGDNDPFGGPAGNDPFAQKGVSRSRGVGLNSGELTYVTDGPAGDAPFGAGNDPFGQEGGSRSDHQRAQSAQEEASLTPYVQKFDVELVEVAADGQSLRKVQVKGAAKVTPENRSLLPDVSIDRVSAVNRPDARNEGGMEGGYGMEDGYGGGYTEDYGAGGEFPSDEMYGGADYGGGMGRRFVPAWHGLSDQQRDEILRRVTWQAQADWVRRLFSSDRTLDEDQKGQLKELVREILKRQYFQQLRREAEELDVVERRLKSLRQQFNQRADAIDRVVDFELQRLELEAVGMGLGPDVGLQPVGPR